MLKRIFLLLVLMAVFALPVGAQEADLEGIKTYLLDKATLLNDAAQALNEAAQEYYQLAETADFDYSALSEETNAAEAIVAAKEAWITASPLYEQIEGVVAGVPSLSEYDVILDAGVSGEEDPEGGVPFDLTLPDGTVLERPGNLFGLLEATLWGTREAFSSGIEVDLDASGAVDFGEVLPDANMLAGTAETFAAYTEELLQAAEEWTPNETDAFTALVVMIPTMSEYFGSWKESRFVAGEDSTQAEFVVISRLSDIQDILSGLQVIYEGVSPLVETVESTQAEQIRQDLTDLKDYVADLYTQEQDGKVFTAEEADFLGGEAQDRAQQIVGQITQIAALLEIELPE